MIRYSKLHHKARAFTEAEREAFLRRQSLCLTKTLPGRSKITPPHHLFVPGDTNVSSEDRKTTKVLSWCRICGAVQRLDTNGTDIA